MYHNFLTKLKSYIVTKSKEFQLIWNTATSNINTNKRIYLNYLKVLHVYSLLDVFWDTDIKRCSSTMKIVWMSISFYTVFTVVGLTQMRAPIPGLQLEHLSPCLWSSPTPVCHSQWPDKGALVKMGIYEAKARIQNIWRNKFPFIHNIMFLKHYFVDHHY